MGDAVGGTSSLCSALHRRRDQVAINEPTEVFAALGMRRPWGVPLLHADLRARICAGEPVANRLSGTQVAEDTARDHVHGACRPTAGRDDFGLWTQNTLASPARLGPLHAVMPWAPLAASVRHPFDTIGSWIASFAHLRDAAVEQFPVGSPTDPLLGAAERERLAAIAVCTDPALRRALLWRHLALPILESRSLLTIVWYEELVTAPATVLARLVGLLPGGPAVAGLDGLVPSVPSRSRERLDDRDRDAIRTTCADVARELGYDL